MKITGEDSNLIQTILSSFICKQDEDIEDFLHNRALEFERLSKARTYLVYDSDQLEKTDLGISEIPILGYISLALKVLSIPDKISNRARKELDGFSPKMHGEIIKDIPCYLIGQLARNSSVSKEKLPGEFLLNYANTVISTAQKAVGGRYVLIECHPKKQLIDFYSKNYFHEFARIPDKDKPMVQLLRKI